MYIVHGASWRLRSLNAVIGIRSSKGNFWGYVRSSVECGEQGNDFVLIPTMKMETRHTIEIYFGREFPAICYHCGVLAARSRQNWNIFEKILRFLEKRPLIRKFSNSVRKVHIATPIDVVVFTIRENCLTGNR